MGYYPGETLKEKIAKSPISPEAAIDIAIQLASGMKEAHEHGVIHRDIKPGNIMITDEDTVNCSISAWPSSPTKPATPRSARWRAPLPTCLLSRHGARAIDQRTDIWSFGVVLYEMLTGKRPFGGENAQSAIRAILEEDPEPPLGRGSEIPEPLIDILGLCLAKDPDHRYQSAEDLAGGPAARPGRFGSEKAGRSGNLEPPITTLALGAGRRCGRCDYCFDRQCVIRYASSLPPRATFTRITEGAIVEDKGNFALPGLGGLR